MDFTAFEKKVPVFESIKAFFARLRQNIASSKIRAVYSILHVLVVGFFVLFSLFMFVFSLLAYLRQGDGAPIAAVILSLLVFIAAVLLIAYAFKITGKNIVVMQRFAKDNGLTFYPNIKVDRSQGLAFRVTTLRLARNGVGGLVKGKTVWMYEYRFNSGTARHPYPNIFTVFLIRLSKQYAHSLFINKRGRIKMIWPKEGLEKVESPWHGFKDLWLYTENGQIDSVLSKLMTEEKIKQILDISPKAEVEIKDKSLRIFLPGKPVPTSVEAEKLFDFANKL